MKIRIMKARLITSLVLTFWLIFYMSPTSANGVPFRLVDQDTISHTRAVVNETARLFSDKDNISSVILYIPADSIVEILGSEDDFFLVRFKNIEGFIFQRKVRGYENIRNSFFEPPKADNTGNITTSDTRLSELIHKYGAERGRKIAQHKIWRGMTREMVIDSWGKPRAINVYGTRMTRREEWVYNRYTLIFENGVLSRWR